MEMSEEYVENRDGGYWIGGTRISLDSIIYAFNRGASAESIKQSFPLLSLEQVYGSLTFYLANQEMIDAYLIETEGVYQQEAVNRRQHINKMAPHLMERLANAEKVVR